MTKPYQILIADDEPSIVRIMEEAFVFMEEDYSDVAVPPWAMKLIIEKEALEEETALRLDYELIEQGMKYEY